MEKGLIPVGDVKEMAQTIAKSGLFPDINTTEKAFTLMMLCQAEGLHPMEALRRYNIISGRPAMKADAMLAEFNRRGGRVEWLQHTDQVVKAKFTHPNGSSIIIEWTIERAAKIMQKGYSLTKKDNWKNYPRQMLRARTISEGVRAIMPEVCVGIYTPEEISDLAEQPKQPTQRPELKAPEPKQPVETKAEVVEEKATEKPRPSASTEPKATKPANKVPKSFQEKVAYLRKEFAKMRKILGEENFTAVLRLHGYNSLKEVKKLNDGEQILMDMKDFAAEKENEGEGNAEV